MRITKLRPMNLANQITIFRILLIPVFIGLVIYYGKSVQEGMADESLRHWATGVFATAALSDALDGWIARRFNQKSRLGAILDPLADKLLILSALVSLSFTGWRPPFPLWFPLLIIFKDIASIGAAFLIDHLAGKCQIQAHWTGKVTTGALIAAVLWSLLDIRFLPLIWPVLFTTFFAVWSGMIYIVDATRQIKAAGH